MLVAGVSSLVPPADPDARGEGGTRIFTRWRDITKDRDLMHQEDPAERM